MSEKRRGDDEGKRGEITEEKESHLKKINFTRPF